MSSPVHEESIGHGIGRVGSAKHHAIDRLQWPGSVTRTFKDGVDDRLIRFDFSQEGQCLVRELESASAAPIDPKPQSNVKIQNLDVWIRTSDGVKTCGG
jgi:hypothetical protein